VALWLTVPALAGAQRADQVSKPDALALRGLLTEALAFPGGKSAGRLAKQAKKLDEGYSLDALIAVLREGPALPKGEPEARKVGKKKERLARFGTAVVGYSFEHAGDVYRYAVDIPQGYDPGRPVPLLVDPGHGTGAQKDDAGKADFLPFFRGQASGAGGEGWLVARTEIVEQIGAGGVRGERPEDEVAAVFDAFFRDIATRFALDLDRTFVAGLSQTGYWAWYLGRARADRWAGLAPMSAVTWQVNGYLENFARLPVYVLHGDADAVCPVAQPRALCAELERLGYPVEYEEVAGAGHEVAVWGRLHKALTWLAERPRDPYPKSVSKSLQTLASPWCHWIRVDELERPGDGVARTPPTAQVSATIEGQTIRIDSEGIERLTVCLASELVDLAQPVRVVWNEQPAFEGELEPCFATALELACEKVDWRAVYVATIELE
jgi:predicted esterase